MPKPRTARRELRRTARNLARDTIEAAIRAACAPHTVPPETRDAYLDEFNRSIAYVSRARITVHRPSLATGDRARVAGSETGKSGA